MRPGQTAPECRVAAEEEKQRPGASMRPGQTAPECRTDKPKKFWRDKLQ